MKLFRLLPILILGLVLFIAKPAEAKWIVRPLPADVNADATLKDVEYVGSNIIVAVGNSLGTNYIIRSIDGGNNWTKITLPAGLSGELEAVDFFGGVGWATTRGGSIIKSTNEGTSWTRLTTTGLSDAGFGIKDMQFDSPTRGFLVGGITDSPRLYRTLDGGTTWENRTATTLMTGSIEAIYMLPSSTVGYIVGEGGQVSRTTTDGSSWDSFTTVESSRDLYDIHCTDDTRCWAVSGEDRSIYRTTNGTTWSRVATSFGVGTYRGIFNLSDTYYWLVQDMLPGESGTQPRVMDSGIGPIRDFVYGGEATNVTAHDLFDIKFLNATTGIVVGAGVILKFDSTAPSGSVFINAGATYANATSVTLTLTCTDNTACDQMQISTDGTLDTESWQSLTVSRGVTLPSEDGTKTVKVKFRDQAQNASAEFSDTIVLDTTAPSAPTNLIRTTPDTDNTPTFTWSAATDNVGVTWYVFDNPLFGSQAVGVTTYTTSELAVGNYTVSVRARDAVGNWSSAASLSFTISVPEDTTPPSTPGGLTHTTPDTDTTPTFTWSAATDNVAVTAYEVRLLRTSDLVRVVDDLNIGNVLTYTLPDALALSTGVAYDFRVKALDAAGNNGQWSTPTAFTISAIPDTTPPSAPAGLTHTTTDSNNTPTFTWNAATDNVGVSSYEYQLDGGVFQSTGTALSATLSATSIGSHTFGVRARDAAGNISATTALSFTISAPLVSADTTAPTAPTGLMRTTTDTNTAPSFNWTASTDSVGVTGYDIQIDGGTFITIGTVLTYAPGTLVTGNHTFGVRARDVAGNISSVSTISFAIVTASTSGTTAGTGTTSGTAGGIGTGGTTGTSSGSGTSVATNRPPSTLDQMLIDAQTIVQGNIAVLLPTLGVSNAMLCQMDPIAAALKVKKVFPNVTDPTVHAALNHFTSCGTVTTLHLGAGERLGVVNSYKAAFGRLPKEAAHWFDVIKLGNGRFPGETSATAEAGAKTRFRQIYLRAPNMSQPNDSAAVTVMAYGMRPLPRNVASEAAAISIYKKIFGALPSSATQWDALRAIAYSGARRS